MPSRKAGSCGHSGISVLGNVPVSFACPKGLFMCLFRTMICLVSECPCYCDFLPGWDPGLASGSPTLPPSTPRPGWLVPTTHPKPCHHLPAFRPFHGEPHTTSPLFCVFLKWNSIKCEQNSLTSSVFSKFVGPQKPFEGY